MTILELKENKLNLQEELTNLVNASAERKLEEAENAKLVEIRTKIDEIDAQIAEIEKENREIKENNKVKETKKMAKEIRLVDAINNVVNGNIPDEQRAMMKNSNTINYRSDIVAGVDAQGGYNVPEEKKGLDVAIRNASVLNKIGATWFSNAVGDISIPKYSGSNVAWKGEISAATDGAGTFSETVLKPKRLTAYIDISKTFLAQDSNDAESILIKDLAEAIAEKFDKTVFGSGTGTTDEPAGLFSASGVVTGTDLSAVTYDSVLELESAVEEKNGTEFIFIANPKVKYALKGTQMASGLQMVWNAGEVDGYKAVVSNSVENKGIICMNPRDLAVATWSGIEITVDTVSRAIYNEVRLVVNFLCDAKLRGERIALEIFD